MNAFSRIPWCIFATIFVVRAVSAGEFPIDLSAIANLPWTSDNGTGGVANGSTFPTGLQNFGGIPFVIPTGPNNYWNAGAADNFGSDTVSVTVPVGLYGATSVFTVSNTIWGQPGPNAYVYITFTGSNGMISTLPIVGDVNIRDHNEDGYTNSINNYSTVQVWANGLGQRLDRQEYLLPAAFARQALESITITDTGNRYLSRAFLAALTVSTCASYVTDVVGITSGPIVYRPNLNLYEQEVTFTNAGKNAAIGPLFFVLENLPAGVGLANASGESTCFAPIGSPYAIVLKPGESLAPGTSLVSKLAFQDVSGSAITYTPLILGSLGGKP